MIHKKTADINMKKYILLFILAFNLSAYSQEALNAYKYVIVPSQFEFQKKIDQYGINTLLKYKFQQLGFETFLDNEEIPMELKVNTCIYITPRLIDSSTMFTTKLTVEIKDCYGKVLFATKEGRSRSKSYEVAYKEALRSSLTYFGSYRLNYTPKNNTVEDVAKLQDELKVKTTPIVVSNTMRYTFNNQEFLFVKEGANFSIKNKSDVVGVCIASTLKNNIYHVTFKSQKGIGYFVENGNFMLEIIENNSVQLLTMVKVN